MENMQEIEQAKNLIEKLAKYDPTFEDWSKLFDCEIYAKEYWLKFHGEHEAGGDIVKFLRRNCPYWLEKKLINHILTSSK